MRQESKQLQFKAFTDEASEMSHGQFRILGTNYSSKPEVSSGLTADQKWAVENYAVLLGFNIIILLSRFYSE